MPFKPQTRMQLMIVAGEPSGDLHASHVVQALKAKCSEISFHGMGGDMMEEAGVSLDIHIRDSAVMGFAEAFAVLPKFLKKQALLKKRIRQQPPDALLLIDFAEFNMPLAKYANAQGVPVVYYIPPKAWAWRPGRAKKLAKRANAIASIFPFETEFYQDAGAPAEFVGHPLVDFAKTDLTPTQAREKLGLQNNTQVIGLMPGSRRSEVQRMLPIMLKAAANVVKDYADSEWVLPLAPGISEELISHCTEGIEGVPTIKLLHDQTYAAMRAATLMLITSGTATLEAACIGSPMIILYRTSWLNWRIINALTPLEHSGLPNLIAKKRIVPELLQDDLTPNTLTELTLDLLRNPEKLKTQRDSLNTVYQQLGESGAAERTAQLVLEQVASARNPTQ
ncbi:MAG: lipid-A-disaccharide synthase [Candidatus Poribacteria bacterium]|nr:lipid-A-disaccharide synthase [Candidatus Poribacteria bacterium]